MIEKLTTHQHCVATSGLQEAGSAAERAIVLTTHVAHALGYSYNTSMSGILGLLPLEEFRIGPLVRF